MFYVLRNVIAPDQAINVAPSLVEFGSRAEVEAAVSQDYASTDIDIVDDSLLNTAPHNAVERQLLNGDMIGLALMSGAIIWSAMGAFG